MTICRLLSPFAGVRKTRQLTLIQHGIPVVKTPPERWRLPGFFPKNQCWDFSGLPDLGGVMNDPTGTTTCFGFLGFLASLFPRTWPFAMVILLAAASEVLGRAYAALHTQHGLIIGRCARIGDLLSERPGKAIAPPKSGWRSAASRWRQRLAAGPQGVKHWGQFKFTGARSV